MFFGEVAVTKAIGGLLAHGAGSFNKGHVLTSQECIELEAQGISQVVIARFEDGDVEENEAATRLTANLSPSLTQSKASTGRVNIFAAHTGLFYVNSSLIEAFNSVDESITLASLANYTRVEKGDMVATLKIIPYAVQEKNLLKALPFLNEQSLEIKPYTRLKIALVQTLQPKTLQKVIDKTLRVTQNRVEALGGKIVHFSTCSHSRLTLRKACKLLPENDILVIFGASAISDRRDILPSSIDKVFHLGLPVDPGNLLMLGEHNGKPVIGAPGCARSPKENGFDFILARLMTGENPKDINASQLGVGGLLTEIASRPAPRLEV
jgi:molybdenum cofactor cytidylyltransferase